MKKYLIGALLCVALLAAMIPSAFAADNNYTACMAAMQEQKIIQAQAHLTAEKLRKQGYNDDSPYIQAAKSTWNAAQEAMDRYQMLSRYTDEEIRILATTVWYEAGSTTEELRQYVAQVVLNRVADSRFPNDVRSVVAAPGQYAGDYVTESASQKIKDKDIQNGTSNWATCVNSAKRAMMGLVDMPSNVLFQANFTQGKGVLKSIYFNSGWFSSTSYFCYG